ncbi:inter-alpha-trypsin inhibitor heavy chain H3-like isoform X2 [Hoplias malabaricus]|uniref:inter-alpha-trypsin inhibitor heavy chain H3-like isoform X2 n=1 Tax=Hoplias malabaricus TaxID=27720 RepID=UPI003461C210
MDRGALSLAVFGLLLICVSAAPTTKEQNIDIYSFYINSTVTSRYAVTVITSRVANRLNESKEVHFQVQIPKNAFISRFRMTMEGKTYDGVVKEKEQAQQQYSQAVSRGESAGIVSSVGRTLEEFKTSVTVGAFSKVTFELTYEELLIRRLGQYQLLINAQPMQTVADFKIDVCIRETPGISFVDVKGGLKSKELTNALTIIRSDEEVWVKLYPTREQQIKCDGCGENGLKGDLIINYDVVRQKPSGEIQASNGYFVHYFSPTDIPRISKNVIFIIDKSGSMYGRKIKQTRLAMLRILEDLSKDDHFGLITFDNSVDVWKPELLQASERNLQLAKDFVRKITDRGSTDINAAVLKGVQMIKRHPRKGSASILILLTDGDPTSGETNIERIQTNVKKAIGGKFPLYCLGFGFDVNFEFLQKMALENSGRAVRIYEDSDADLQLKGFYEEVATPLLTDVQLNYTGAGNLTQTTFSHYYNGSEIVVAGQITDNSLESFQTTVIAISESKIVKYEDIVSMKDVLGVPPQQEKFIQRLWAYLTVKQLLEKEMTLEGEQKEKAKKEVLRLSLQYEFVTPLTSMVVTKPEEEKTQVAHKPKEGEQPHLPVPQRPAPPSIPIASTYDYDDLDHYVSILPPRIVQKGTRVIGSGSGLSYFAKSIVQEIPPAVVRVQAAPTYPGTGGALGSGPAQAPGRAVTVLTESIVQEIPPAVVRVQAAPTYPDVFHDLVLEEHPTIISSVTVAHVPFPPENSVRILVPAKGPVDPLCYDVPLSSKLQLLKDPSSEFIMNGELTSHAGHGFKKLALHYKSKYDLNISQTEINYSDGSNLTRFTWGQQLNKSETDGVSLSLREDALDITMGTVRVAVLLHQKDGERFLWPAVHQQPKDITWQGILGKTNVEYELLHNSKIKIKDQETQAVLTTATDYSLPSADGEDCLFVTMQFVLQRDLSDFTVSQI